MPIYEFRCRSCGQKTSVFVQSVRSAIPDACPTCGGHDMARLVSSFAYHKSEATRREEAGDPASPGPDYYKDPRNIGRWAEKRLQEMGVEMPAQAKEMIQAAREGELPPPVKDL
ncbi:MAG: zinc ribbon domain-containing protein [Chloroflexi bacterium]|nr:zinc ribbon domain-containing protein [Chloroflexota bacterium]